MGDLERTVSFADESAEGSARRSEILVGDRIGPYRVEALLGSGGFAEVYQARHADSGTVVAVKVLSTEFSTNPELLLRFRREADVLERLRHPNIVGVTEFGILPSGRPYIVMEHLSGESLARWLERRGPVMFDELVSVIRPLCGALEAAHQAGIVHRDLKPGNVHLTGEGAGPVVKLLDFGIAKLLKPEDGPGLTRLGDRLGTSFSMAPEQIRGDDVDPRTDIYALGVMMFRMVTGLRLFEAKTSLETERLHLEMPPPPPSQLAPGIPPALEKVILTCLQKEPDQRYRSVAEVLAALEAARPRTSGALALVEVSAWLVSVLPAPQDVDPDEHALDAGRALDECAARLEESGCDIVLQTSDTVLALRRSSVDEDGGSPLKLGEALVEVPATLALALSVSVRVHRTSALESADTRRYVGGEAFRLEAWRGEPTAGVSLTPAASRPSGPSRRDAGAPGASRESQGSAVMVTVMSPRSRAR